MPILLALLAIVVIVVVVLVVTSGGGGSGGTAAVKATVESGSGVAVHSAQTLPDAPLALAPDTADTWAATGDRLFQISAASGTQIADQRPSPGPASALGVDVRGRVWVAGAGGNSVVRQAADNVIATGAGTNLFALDSHSALDRRPRHEHGDPRRPRIARRRARYRSPGRSRRTGPPSPGCGSPPTTATSPCWTATVSRDALPAPNVVPGTVGVVPSNGVWFVSSDGTLNRIDPRTTINGTPVTGHYVEHPVPLHRQRRRLRGRRVAGHERDLGAQPRVEVTRADRDARPGDGKITARITFSATPGHLAVGDHVVWVDFPSAKTVIPISY